jgi:hypothetical protein
MPIPISRTIKRRTDPFECQGCGKMLELAKVSMLVLVPLIAVTLLISKMGGLLAVAAALVLIAVADWKTARISIADGEEPS